MSLWQNPNWNAKWDSEDNCEERYWNQIFTLKGTFKSSLRMEQGQIWDGAGDAISTLCCSFESHLHDFSSLIKRELPSCRQRLTSIPFHFQHNRPRDLTHHGVAAEVQHVQRLRKCQEAGREEYMNKNKNQEPVALWETEDEWWWYLQILVLLLQRLQEITENFEVNLSKSIWLPLGNRL